MENILLSVVPVGEIRLVRSDTHKRDVLVISLLLRFLFRGYFKVLEVDTVSRTQFHSVWVDNFSFFFKIKSIFLSQ